MWSSCKKVDVMPVARKKLKNGDSDCIGALIASNDQFITDFADYKVCRVADFLSSLTGMDLDLIKKNFPANILEGIVNASHMVNLNRDKDPLLVLVRANIDVNVSINIGTDQKIVIDR